MTPDLVKMTAVVADHATVSDKVRALNRAGYSRADIARFLGKRYQQVRNVLVGDEQTSSARLKPTPQPSTISSEGVQHRTVKIRVGPDGRIEIPVQFRGALGLKEGAVLFARLDDGEINLLTPGAAMRRAQAAFAPYRRPGVSEVDEFLAERRKMWGEENDG